MELDTESKMMNYVRKLKYLVVFPDKKTEIYSSLREISLDISEYKDLAKKMFEHFNNSNQIDILND